MNLSYVHKLLVAADQQPHGFLRVRGQQADQQVRLMVRAGLVDATLSNGNDESFTAINRLTDLGRTFLRTFKDRPPKTRTASEWQSDCQGTVLEKWNVNFALDLRRPERAD